VSTAADEVDDFVGVVLLDAGFGPLRARENIAIPFNGDALGVDAEMFEKLKDVQAVWNVAGFAVDGDGQDITSRELALYFSARTFANSTSLVRR
jgi:hypothetical protein